LFYFRTAYEWIWLPTDEKVPDKERRRLQSKELMLSFVWNSNACYLIGVLTNERKFEASSDADGILGRVSESGQGQRDGATRRLAVHADNSRPFTAITSILFVE
jgi:hypothetical protein